ncbi:glycosyltransferase family 4 protein [Salinibacterium sp. dk2585]|uniref:glycosyltransferase family 4 protein n=1 Tax=unclassified Salinibacterium TaxID=2632331 RepID=UPI0011C242A3|nr:MULTISPECIES: glycosyltransferase family 4 protein [unclassified Salinibacterium]QEE61366.1 glycosyltransferase family 4 protein [Salinibacterium sp. dk2585]TXK54043.1 glycosyltransferase family 4 protein [Salinibacterium sp. dk5596]
MRIAIVSDYLLDYVGGAQTSMLQQRKALQDAGHEVLLVSAKRMRGARLQADGDELHVRPDFVLPALLLPVVPNTARLRSMLRQVFERQRVEVVHVQTEFALAHAAADVAREMGIPLVHTVHTFYWASEGRWHVPLAPLVRTLLERFTGTRIPRLSLSQRGGFDDLLRNLTLAVALRADTVVSPSAHQARDLQDAGVEAPVEVVPNPIATSGRLSVPLSEEAAAHPSFLWVARCEAVKRPLVFAEAAVAALQATPGAFSVDFVGDGSELAALRRVVADRPEIRVHGNLPHERVLQMMDESAMVVLTSLGFDNQPMTIAEAVSRQRGVLYCDPKLREGLESSGYLSETPDAEGLATALTALSRDPQRVLELSRGAVRDRELFDPAHYVERMLAIYAA